VTSRKHVLVRKFKQTLKQRNVQSCQLINEEERNSASVQFKLRKYLEVNGKIFHKQASGSIGGNFQAKVPAYLIFIAVSKTLKFSLGRKDFRY